MTTKHIIAVYGTLIDRLGTGIDGVLDGHALLDTQNGFPVVLPRDKYSVNVQVCEVTDEKLRDLDRYEGVASGLYTREKARIWCVSLGKYVDAYIYIGGEMLKAREQRMEVVPDGDWMKYRGRA